MAEKTCGNCKHWKDYKDCLQKVEGEYGLCARIKMQEYYSDDDDRLTNDDLAYAQDGSGYYAAIISKADFGCSMWEAKVHANS